MKITETNCETGETVERDMTPEEELEHEARLFVIADAEAQIASKEQLKASAQAKLQALGLTAEEVQALLGAV
ncbi:hypothetical protein UFOVP223_88 [uncultured Caudovirales phage]|uniref:Uncharacterized protein n=1 Tax=uncultured Caudovirales phage TaxID=2100421 RepID=A0A6J5L4L7_9CAUD|nr:hypothetical protein UFOVP110_76 [uncultured Caudovirales phage]CAB5219528.1 hypothetical protein UFOVP223_88 [uncultured Caudovirales phage]